jgi:hypothetical protein
MLSSPKRANNIFKFTKVNFDFKNEVCMLSLPKRANNIFKFTKVNFDLKNGVYMLSSPKTKSTRRLRLKVRGWRFQIHQDEI